MGRRDRALILLGFWRGFRGDELLRLRLEGITVVPDQGMRLYLLQSKGDRQAAGGCAGRWSVHQSFAATRVRRLGDKDRLGRPRPDGIRRVEGHPNRDALRGWRRQLQRSPNRTSFSHSSAPLVFCCPLTRSRRSFSHQSTGHSVVRHGANLRGPDTPCRDGGTKVSMTSFPRRALP